MGSLCSFCFLIQIAGGITTKRLMDVQIGDRVEVVGNMGKVEISEVYWMEFHHEVVEMVEVTMRDPLNNQSYALLLTPEHLLYHFSIFYFKLFILSKFFMRSFLFFVFFVTLVVYISVYVHHFFNTFFRFF